MNLSVSYKWLKEYLPGLKADPEEVAAKLSLHSFSVERWQRTGEGLNERIVVGKIKKIEQHPNADKLKVAHVQVSPQSTIDSSQKIVCGGTNIREGQLVALALSGAKVRWHGEGELIELKPTEIRGVRSEGMICAANEIGLFEMFPHKEREILDLTATGAQVGVPLAKALGLDDTIFEVEVTTNRPDAMGIVGLAREVGAIFGVPLKLPQIKQIKQIKQLEVRIETSKLCPRYIAVMMEGIKVAPSPWWLQRKLIASGIRPINNLVDITNYVLLEYGQPCHAFDAGKLSDGSDHATAVGATRGLVTESCSIVVRMARKGEKILALDGNTYGLDENILVIADAKRPVAIAGIMGGEETGVHADTTRIVYEIANFDPITVRKGEHQLALTSDSSARFNKGLPVKLSEYAAARLIELTKEVVGGEVMGVVDKKSLRRHPECSEGSRGSKNGIPRGVQPRTELRSGAWARNDKLVVAVSPQDVAQNIGIDIPRAQMKKYLTALGFKVSGSAKKWSVAFPYWRTVEADGVADISEEVARMYGYHNLPSVLPAGTLPDEAPNPDFAHEQTVKDILRGAGFTELYTYSFVSSDDIIKAGLDAGEDAAAIANPLTSELTHMRPWLGISILRAIEKNQTMADVLKFFELSNEYHPRHSGHSEPAHQSEARCGVLLREESRALQNGILRRIAPQDDTACQLPEERQKLIVAGAGKEEHDGENFYIIKGLAEYLAVTLGLPKLSFVPAPKSSALYKWFHPARVIWCKAGEDFLGPLGEAHPTLLKAFGITRRVAFLDWEIKALFPLIGKGRVYKSPLAYPPVKRDVAFIVSKSVQYASILETIVKLDPLIYEVELFDQYEGKGVPADSRSLAFHITYASYERTLTAEEAERVHDKLTKILKEKFDAKVRE